MIGKVSDPNGNTVAYVKTGCIPPKLSEEDIAALEQQVVVHLQGLEAAAPEWIAQKVTIMLTHFYVAEMPAALAAALIEDWIDDLAEFPEWAISAAIKDYRTEEKRKPTIADIVSRCVAKVSEPKAQLAALQLLLDFADTKAIASAADV